MKATPNDCGMASAGGKRVRPKVDAAQFFFTVPTPLPPRASPPVPPTAAQVIERLAIVSTGRNRLFQVPVPP